MWVGGGKPGLWSRWGGIERWSPILGASAPVTKLSGKRGMVISAFSFSCSGESSTQLSKTSPLEGCLNFRRVKKYRKERVRSSGCALWSLFSAQEHCPTSVDTPAHLLTLPGAWPPNSDAVSHCNGCGHYSAHVLGDVLSCGGCSKVASLGGPMPTPCHADFSWRPWYRARASLAALMPHSRGKSLAL